MNRWPLILGVITWAASLVLAIAGNYLLTYHLIQQRQAVWCPLLASVHVPEHPTPAQARGLAQIDAVKREFGC